MLKAVLALDVIRQHYVTDETRVYIAGFSGGGKVASRVARDFASSFTGAIFIGGVLPGDGDEPADIDIMRANRYVFLSGEFDGALASTKRVYRQYRAADIASSKLMIVRGMGHSNPPGREFRKAIDFLDRGAEDAH
jgi:predicted peptidase